MSTQAHHVIAGADLRRALYRRYLRTPLKPPFMGNKTYHCVTVEWVDRVFAPYLKELQWSLNKDTWRQRGNQCEHFAMRTVMAAVDCLDVAAQQDESITAESIAIGLLPYTQDRNGSGHAIVTWFIGGEFSEWEPQTQRWVTLSPAERASAYTPIFL
ncbi:hypothetical protein [Actomonas aquatica]|uniref:Transglutaminase-like domain-containing protein n=1 Tax=Actomonas aquatica TaxID=2866162 RepID=A0ABZ1CDC7_9BACT|nr:hypothetical protein [Opitutus sp. WL0086]WRQ89375.1 hypothetical protein K1X11_008135 [Opitutus sp. WL0086]